MSGALFGELSKKQKDEVIKEVGKEAAARFKTYLSALKGSMDFKLPTSDRKLMFYRTRMPEVWAQIQNVNDDLYKKQMKEWQDLEVRNQRRMLTAWNPFNPKSSEPAHIPDDMQGLV
jgi:hypothetical protein